LRARPDMTLRAVCEFLNIDGFPDEIDPIFVRPVQILPYLTTAAENDQAYLTGIYENDVIAVEALKLEVI